MFQKKDCKKNRVGRQEKSRKIFFQNEKLFFKPQGVPLSELKIIFLKRDEVEALRLKDVLDLNQEESALKMGISQSTFARILASARKKVSEALIKSYGIKICNKK